MHDCNRYYHGAMDHTRRWWIVRIELAIGLVAVALGVLVFALMPVLLAEPNPQGDPLILAGLIGLAAGLIWLFRIFRGPRDRPTTWRYRHR
jgi:hypothetical protein